MRFEEGNRVKLIGTKSVGSDWEHCEHEIGDVCIVDRADNDHMYNNREYYCVDGNHFLAKDLEPVNGDGKTEEVIKMPKAETKLEKEALKKAKADVIEQAIKDKAEIYNVRMRDYISNVENAKIYNNKVAELEKELGITKEEKENLF